MLSRLPRFTLFPYTTLFRPLAATRRHRARAPALARARRRPRSPRVRGASLVPGAQDRERRTRRRRTQPCGARDGGDEGLMPRPRQGIALLHYTAPSILGGVEQVLGAHAAGLRALGAEVTIVAGRGRVAAGTRLARVPELDSRHPAVLRDFAALARRAAPSRRAVGPLRARPSRRALRRGLRGARAAARGAHRSPARADLRRAQRHRHRGSAGPLGAGRAAGRAPGPLSLRPAPRAPG